MYEGNTEKVVGIIAKNDQGDFIRVARITPRKGLEAIDIRNFYTNVDDEQCPTQKGVRFHSEMLVEVVTAILEACTDEEFNEVMSHFQEDEDGLR